MKSITERIIAMAELYSSTPDDPNYTPFAISLSRDNPKGELQELASIIREHAALLAVAEAAKHWEVCTYPEEIDFRCGGCNKARAAYANLAVIRSGRV